ncbi:SymE family type I addiction module toxin [Enterobacter chuandaensis]|uniref:SymE family type I addiction module toxin n=1 Tax=Enterobacter chuandaensis TaxID=2497875 RepID=UPI0039C30BBD
MEGYRPNVFVKSRPKIILSSKWLRAAGFDTGQQVTVKVMKGCIVLVVYKDQEPRLQDDYKRMKAKLVEIVDAHASIQTPRPGKCLANSNTNHLA